MDQDTLRALSTLFVFVAFIALSASVFWRGRKPYFDQAAQLPFADDTDQEEPRND